MVDLITPVKLLLVTFNYFKILLAYILIKALNLITFTRTWECYYCQTHSTFGVWNYKEYKASHWYFWFCKHCCNINRWKSFLEIDDNIELTEEEASLIDSYTTPNSTPTLKHTASFKQEFKITSGNFKFCSECQKNHEIVLNLKSQYLASDEKWDKISTSQFNSDFEDYSKTLDVLYPPVCRACADFAEPELDQLRLVSAKWSSNAALEFEQENYHILYANFVRKRDEPYNIFKMGVLSMGYLFTMFKSNSIPKAMETSSIIFTPWIRVFRFLKNPNLYQFKLNSFWITYKFVLFNYYDIAIITITYYILYYAYQTTTLRPKRLQVQKYASATSADKLELYMPTFVFLVKLCWFFRFLTLLNYLNVFINLSTVSSTAHFINLKYIKIGNWANIPLNFFSKIQSFSLYFDTTIVAYLTLMVFGIGVPKIEEHVFNTLPEPEVPRSKNWFACPPLIPNDRLSSSNPEEVLESLMAERMAHISLESDSKNQFNCYKSIRPISPTTSMEPPSSPQPVTSIDEDQMDVEIIKQKCEIPEYVPRYHPGAGGAKLIPGFSQAAIESMKAVSNWKRTTVDVSFLVRENLLPVEEEPELELMMSKLKLEEPPSYFFRIHIMIPLVAWTIALSITYVLHKIYY